MLIGKTCVKIAINSSQKYEQFVYINKFECNFFHTGENNSLAGGHTTKRRPGSKRPKTGKPLWSLLGTQSQSNVY